MLEDTKITVASREDSDKIINMLKESARWMKENGINQWGYLLNGGDDEEILEGILNEETYMVQKSGELITTFTLSERQSEWDRHIFGEDKPRNSIYLQRLAVVPKYMGKGIGKEIINWIEENCSFDKEYLLLDCVASNERLNRFYIENGFEYLGETDRHSKYQKKLNSKQYYLRPDGVFFRFFPYTSLLSLKKQ